MQSYPRLWLRVSEFRVRWPVTWGQHFILCKLQDKTLNPRDKWTRLVIALYLSFISEASPDILDEMKPVRMER